MATSYTALLGLALPVTGELQGTWGDTVNNQLTSLLDTAVAGTTTISTDADVTLSTTTGAANQARQAIILWTANGSVTRNITAPAQSKTYVVINASAGTQSIVIRGVGPTTGVTVAKGEKVVVAWDGSDFVRVAAYGGTGEFTTVDTTNLEVTNIKAKDGTASATIADSTGVMTIASSVLTTADINGGTMDNVTIGGSTPAAGNFTNLDATGTLAVDGNVTLGNATTDTVQVNGYMGVGGAANSAISVYARGSALIGSNQYGAYAFPTVTSTATTGAYGVVGQIGTEAASFTVSNAYALSAFNAVKGAGSTITNQHGVYIADQTQGTNNYGITSLVSSGANKWNIYASGTAANYFAGNVGIGVSTVANTGKVEISSSAFDTVYLTRTSAASASLIVRDSGDSGFLLQNKAGGGLNLLTRVSGVNSERFGLTTTEAVFNDPGNDYDFRVESDTNTHALFVQGSDGNVGIGTASPAARLHALNTSAGEVARFMGNASENNANGFRIEATGTLNRHLRLISGATQVFRTFETSTGNVANDSDIVFDARNKIFRNNDGTSEQVRIDSSGNVGIGTSSPTATGNYRVTEIKSSDTTSGGMLIVGTSNNSGVGRLYSTSTQVLLDDSGSTSDIYIKTNGSNNLLFGTNNTERLRIDSSGNLGLGVTPRTSTGSYKAFEFGQSGYLTAVDSGAGISLASNGYIASGAIWTYSTTGAATHYGQVSGQHLWYTAPSGTAGAAITFTERASIGTTEFVVNNPGEDYDFRVESDTNTHALFVDAGNDRVGIGTGSPTQKLEVQGADVGAGSGETVIRITQPASTVSARSELRSGVTSGTNPYLAFAVRSAISPFDVFERLRIDSSGNVGIGTSSPNTKLQVLASSATSRTSFAADAATFVGTGINIASGTTETGIYFADNSYISKVAIRSDASRNLIFDTANTERLRIDSSGNVGIGGTPAAGSLLHTIASSSGTAIGTGMTGLRMQNTNGSANTLALVDVFGSSNYAVRFGGQYTDYANNVADFVVGTRSGGTFAERLRITSDGYLRMASGSLGIQFNGDTAAANALDDYEEGTFTPAVEGTTTAGTGTYVLRSGKYTKIGNVVYFSIYFNMTAHTGTGNMVVTGLPFTSYAASADAGLASLDHINGALTVPANSIPVARVNLTSTTVSLWSRSTAGTITDAALALDTNTAFTLTGFYYV